MAVADLGELTRLLGSDGVRRLIDLAGGLAVRIPVRGPLAGPLAGLPDDLQGALIGHAGGDTLYIPKCDGAARAARDAEIIAAYGRGEPVAELARRHKISERWVWAILSRPLDDRQGQLF